MIVLSWYVVTNALCCGLGRPFVRSPAHGAIEAQDSEAVVCS